MLRRMFVMFVMVLWLVPALAAAQPGPDVKVEANALFDEGKQLLARGDVAQACAKLEESLALLDRLGVRLNLADCYERAGKTATAWRAFREFEARATEAKDSRADFARQRAEALAPRLIRLDVSVAAQRQPAALKVTWDGVELPREALEAPWPIDPGRYVLEASAPGFHSWTAQIEAKEPVSSVVVMVPALEPEVIEQKEIPAKAPVTQSDDGAGPKRRRLGLIVGAGGAAAFVAGVGFGIAARSIWSSADAHCDDRDVCDAEGVEINRRARLYGNVGTVVGGVGVAALVTGAVLYLTAPAARTALEHAYLETSDGATAFGYRGSF